MPGELFDGTAEYYARYRPGIPGSAVRSIVQSAPRFVRDGVLLDLGCGTGQVVLALSDYCSDVIAVDTSAEMVTAARRALWGLDGHVRVIRSKAEAVELPDGWKASLVTISRAFHWMNQLAVLRHIEPHVKPEGVVAVMGESSLWSGTQDWQIVVKQVVQHFLGAKRRAGEGFYTAPGVPFISQLRMSPFSAVEAVQVPFEREWTQASILGYLYSTSFSAKKLYGERRPEFESSLKSALQAMGRAKLVETGEFELLLARRPAAP